MEIAIVYSSRSGTTEEICEVLSGLLEEAGHSIMMDSITSPIAALQVQAAEAVVLGSGVYLEAWTPEMANFIKENRAQLEGKKIAAFSVGMSGEKPAIPHDLPTVAHEYFKGRLPQNSTWGDAMEGDQRDWKAIRAWGAKLPALLND